VIDYDDRARRWLAGELEPAIGREAWTANARREAEFAAKRLHPYGGGSLLEVGSGVGRLTPYLAEAFEYVIAIDTSPGMQECTALACDGLVNVSVRDHKPGEPYPVADAALIFDVIEADWSIEQADALVSDVLRSCLLVLIAQVRLDEWEPYQGQIAAAGAGWWLIQGETL
jgi:SAM-dependent methyltransferase